MATVVDVDHAGAVSGPIRVLALVEATGLGSVAKPIVQFWSTVRGWPGGPPVELRLVGFTRPRTAPLTELAAAADRAGIALHCLEERHRYDPRVAAQLRALVQRSAPDVIETHAVKSHALVRASGVWRNVPWLAFHHGYTTTDLKTRAHNLVDRWSLRADAARVVTVCDAFARELQASARPRRPVAVIHNAADEFEPRPDRSTLVRRVRHDLQIPSDARIVIAVGRLSREKGHVELLRAAAKMHARGVVRPPVIVIVGDGPERARLEATARSLGIAKWCRFPGQVRDVAPYFAAADAMALPSLNEGSPKVLLESLAAGVPVVATATGGVTEIVADGETALLVPPRDAGAMAVALETLLSSDTTARALAERGRRLVRERYSQSARAHELMTLYREAIEEARCAS